MFEKNGASDFGSIGPNGDGDIVIDGKDILARSGNNEPVIGASCTIGSTRIIGDVFLGDNSNVENGTSIRADEGIPIKIGKNAQIGMNNTFHSLNDQEISIGDDLKVGSNVEIGDDAIVVGVNVPDGTVIPSGSVVQTQKDVRMLNPGAVVPGTKWASIMDLFLVSMIPILLGLVVSVILRKK